MQSHSREATGTVTPFDKYAESKSRSDCCAVTVTKRLLPNFVKYAEALLCRADAAKPLVTINLEVVEFW